MAFKQAILIFVGFCCVWSSICAKTTGSLVEEPMCSKYHFEERVLEKLIRLEIQVEQSNLLFKSEIADQEKETNELKLELASARTELEQERNKSTVLRADLESMEAAQKRDSERIAKLSTELEEEKLAHGKDREKLKEELLSEIGTVKSSTSVAFIARNPPTTLPTNVPIIFATTVLNSGDAYNSSTGRFTAPVSGTYLFSVQFCSVNHVIFQIVVNNNVHGVSYQYDAEYDGICSSMTTVAGMQSGQQAWVTQVNIDAKMVSDNIYHWNMFTGALVAPN